MKILSETIKLEIFDCGKVHGMEREVISGVINWIGNYQHYKYIDNQWYVFLNHKYTKCNIPTIEKLYLRNKNLKCLLPD